MNVILPVLHGRPVGSTVGAPPALDELLDPERGPARCHALADDLRARLPHAPDGSTLYAFARLMRALLDVGGRLLTPGKAARVRRRLLGGSAGFESALRRVEHLFPGFFPAARDAGVAAPGPADADAVSLIRLTALALLATNPAASSPARALGFDVLNDDETLAGLCRDLGRALASEAIDADEPRSLWDVLAGPQLAAPDSLEAQLRLASDVWRSWLGGAADDLAVAAAVIHEEHRPRFEGPGPAETPPPPPAPDDRPAGPEPEAERFSEDRGWMQDTVLLAKNTHVWLHQCGAEAGRPITRLDEVPDAVLDRMAEQGVTGLWLIGLWQRSPASREIKRRTGNPEALSSAYAVVDYRIADDLGGDASLDELRARALARGIRLCGDMVPNHTAVDGDWVYDHPDRFLSLAHPPYPNYGFDGPELSTRDEISLKLEDHYWDRTDAAVVFRREDRRTGDVRYLYHGNDGTSMPWNDTAQLDFADHETREAVICAVIEVARRFPIIRFDAAMVLARKHLRRLWHPAPGEASDIATRSAHAVSQADFDLMVPREFWREVVDRVAAEAPDTLLLAEAFWLMESYFVRTLGMHRVYHSAFMHMLRDEDNGKFRTGLKNVLAADPRILQRYVNFMSNPDEETAEAQFGKGDKYFGVCSLMATLPGLPMIGHGQLEGFTEKYGMEYARAYRDESPDEGFHDHHRRMIFPLFRLRSLFAGADAFRLYDAVDADGRILEDVYAYSNEKDGRKVLMLFNHGHESRRFRIRRAWSADGAGPGVAEVLGLPNADGVDVRLRDPRTDLTVSTSCRSLHDEGLELDLPSYGFAAFLDVETVPADR